MKLPWLRLTGAVATGLGLLGLAAVPAIAQDKPVEMRFSHWVPTAHPMHAAAVAWADSINKASNGTVKAGGDVALKGSTVKNN